MPLQAPRLLLRLDAARRLGARPVLLFAWHRARLASGVARLGRGAVPRGPFLPGGAPVPPPLPDAARKAVLDAAARPPRAAEHGPFDPAAPALSLDLFGPGDVRPVWEANRLAWLLTLAQAHRLEPGAGHRARAEDGLARWVAANPPGRGPNWACGQEAALRALHLALAAALLGGGPPSPGLAALLRLHARRIAATRAYAAAQDNNHSVSEPAGLLACAWALRDAGLEARARRGLARAVGRLVAPDGGFAPVSTGYHRLLLDVLSLLEWLRRRHGAAALPAPVGERAGAAARWLAAMVSPGGAVPLLGHQDGSAFADLSLAGPGDARGSVERACRLFLGASAGFGEDPGCAWLGLPSAPPLPRPSAMAARGTMLWRCGAEMALLRTGPLRFRPGQADLLHLDLWAGEANLLRDAGTGSYNPPPGLGWDAACFAAAAAHNLILFDEAEPMPRAGRFLLARWVRTGRIPDGAATEDRRGNRHERQVFPPSRPGGEWRVEDAVSGPFRSIALRWHLPPAPWCLRGEGVDSPLGRIAVSADAPLDLTLEWAWHSPAYGRAEPSRVLVARAVAPVGRLTTRVLAFGSATSPRSPLSLP